MNDFNDLSEQMNRKIMNDFHDLSKKINEEIMENILKRVSKDKLSYSEYQEKLRDFVDIIQGEKYKSEKNSQKDDNFIRQWKSS